MKSLRCFALAGMLAVTYSAGAQPLPAPGSQDHAAHHPPGAAPADAAPADRMAMMDTHMKVMREMHEKMSRASTPEERNALMTEHMKRMQEGMAMMQMMMDRMGAPAAKP